MTTRVSATVLMSGGIDSAACAKQFLDHGYATEGLFVDYGHRAHERELFSATRMANFLGIPFRRLSVRGVSIPASGEIVGRNAFLLFSALFAIGGRPGLLGIGIHAGTPYYDLFRVFL